MATTPVDPRVIEAMTSCLGLNGHFGNPASITHAFGLNAQKRVNTARAQVAALINAEPLDIVWTSGATEADNLAIKGASAFYQRRGRHIITMQTEHKAVLDTCHYLAAKNVDITYLKPQANGLVDLQELADSIRADTLLVSIMLVNNETGVIQDLARIAEIVKSKGVLLHTDAAQANGKIAIDVRKIPIDLMSLSAHKLYGPKGIGALYVRSQPQIHLEPLIHGGEHERGFRSGTLATHQIVGMGAAFELAQREMTQDTHHASQLAQQFLAAISSTHFIQNAVSAPRVPHCLNLCFPAIRAEALMLSTPELAYSSGSACNSATVKPSHVLSAMGLSDALADCCVRISLGRFTTSDDIHNAAEMLAQQVARLKHIVGDLS